MEIIDKLSSYIDTIEDYIDNESNGAAVSLIADKSIKLLKHILPRRMSGEVTFGFEDPYYTGKVLEYSALLYPVFHNIDVHPLFCEKEFNGSVEFKGKIRIAYILAVAARVYFDKNFRRSDIWKAIHQ